MSDEKKPARILYEQQDYGANIECRGTGMDLFRAMVRIILSVCKQTGINIDKFAQTLPGLVLLEEASLEATAKVDLDALEKAQEGAGHE